MAMKHTIEGYKVRAHVLKERDPIANKSIINKLQRKIRKLEGKG